MPGPEPQSLAIDSLAFRNHGNRVRRGGGALMKDAAKGRGFVPATALDGRVVKTVLMATSAATDGTFDAVTDTGERTAFANLDMQVWSLVGGNRSTLMAESTSPSGNEELLRFTLGRGGRGGGRTPQRTDHSASDTRMISASLRTTADLFAYAGAHQTTGRPKALFVGSSRCARESSS